MTLPNAREGVSCGFHLYDAYNVETTIGQREQTIWTSIKLLCATEKAKHVLKDVYHISDKKTLSKIAKNIRLYIKQADSFYSSAIDASSNTSPLYYYYCFMNLAKAVCEIRHPEFHKKPECYHHGLSWHPNPNYLVNIQNESVSISTKGIWHILWGILSGTPCNIPNPTKLDVLSLFACCPEISSEYRQTIGGNGKCITLEKLDLLHNSTETKFWSKFSIHQHDLHALRLSQKRFLNLISGGVNLYRRVINEDDENTNSHCYELITPKTIPPGYDDPWWNLMKSEIQMMNLFSHPSPKGCLSYFIPIQDNLPLALRQLILLYTIMFWLGSLVRYDPHSVAHLQDTRYWTLIEGFISQSRLLLLELFEWQLYQCETHLVLC